MPLKFASRRRLPDGSQVIAVEPEFLLASTMLAHIERLPHVRVLAKRSWAMTDSFEAYFSFKGYRFYMAIPFGAIMIARHDSQAPEAVFDELAAHVENYRTVWLPQFLWALTRYFFLPSKPTDTKVTP